MTSNLTSGKREKLNVFQAGKSNDMKEFAARSPPQNNLLRCVDVSKSKYTTCKVLPCFLAGALFSCEHIYPQCCFVSLRRGKIVPMEREFSAKLCKWLLNGGRFLCVPRRPVVVDWSLPCRQHHRPTILRSLWPVVRTLLLCFP